MINSFNHISFMHISRIFNREADRLSKVAANCNFGSLFYEEETEGKIILEGSIPIEKFLVCCYSSFVGSCSRGRSRIVVFVIFL